MTTPPLIRPSVLAIWHEFSTPLEGRVYWPYLDVRGLVTVGVGNLIDPLGAALGLPWTLTGSGQPASRERIIADWRALKAQPQLAKLHYKYAANVTRIRLTDEAIDNLVASRLQANAADLTRQFKDFPEWPADAQLASLSMAWAVGSGYPKKFPSWSKSAAKQDWLGCKAECDIRSVGNPGVIPRNKLNRAHFEAAANAEDPAVIYGPGKLSALKP